ncbi:MAG: hypothetical protein JNL58_16015 [Planctomyces sp.]|nr:hypothetical protein [Planctomyces sp.]
MTSRVQRFFLAIAIGLGPTSPVMTFAGIEDGADIYENRIRPVLMDSCYRCHSDSVEEPAGGLRLDSVEHMKQGGDLGPAIVDGDPDESLLFKAICYDGLEMPPSEPLSESVIADFRRWIELGAPCSESSVSQNTESICVEYTEPSMLICHPLSGIGNWPGFFAGLLLPLNE